MRVKLRLIIIVLLKKFSAIGNSKTAVKDQRQKVHSTVSLTNGSMVCRGAETELGTALPERVSI
jgi:hypothetical protein